MKDHALTLTGFISDGGNFRWFTPSKPVRLYQGELGNVLHVHGSEGHALTLTGFISDVMEVISGVLRPTNHYGYIRAKSGTYCTCMKVKDRQFISDGGNFWCFTPSKHQHGYIRANSGMYCTCMKVKDRHSP